MTAPKIAISRFFDISYRKLYIVKHEINIVQNANIFRQLAKLKPTILNNNGPYVTNGL